MKSIKSVLFAAVVALASICADAANVAVSVQQVVNSGLATSYTSSGLTTSDTYQFTNDGRMFLHIKKTGAGDCTVTITTPATTQGFAIGDRTVTIAATTGDKLIGPFPASLFNDASELVSFTLSDTVGLSIAALKL